MLLSFSAGRGFYLRRRACFNQISSSCHLRFKARNVSREVGEKLRAAINSGKFDFYCGELRKLRHGWPFWFACASN